MADEEGGAAAGFSGRTTDVSRAAAVVEAVVFESVLDVDRAEGLPERRRAVAPGFGAVAGPSAGWSLASLAERAGDGSPPEEVLLARDGGRAVEMAVDPPARLFS